MCPAEEWPSAQIDLQALTPANMALLFQRCAARKAWIARQSLIKQAGVSERVSE